MSLFKKKISEDQLLGQLRPLLDGFGEYALNQQDPKKGMEMIGVIEDVEKQSSIHPYPSVLVNLGVAYRFYTAWYVRGTAREIYLARAIETLERALVLDPANQKARAELGYLLIEYAPARNLERGVELLESLKDDGQLSETLTIYLNQAYRQLGQIPEQNASVDFSKVSVLPGSLREDRKRYRDLIRQYRNSEQKDKLINVLGEYYNLAILVCAVYADHNCNTGVSGQDHEIAEIARNKIADRLCFSYASHGRIIGGGFLSETDYRSFIEFFGETNAHVDPQQVFAIEIREARVEWEAKTKGELEESWKKFMKEL